MVMIGNKVHTAALVAALCYTGRSDAAASSFHEPHPHKGVVTPFESTLPNIKLDQSAETVLSIGKPYHAQVQQVSKNGGNHVARTMLVQDIKAPVKTVMDRILDYNHYSRMAPNTLESEIYQREQEEQSSTAAERLWVRLKAGVPGLQIQFFCNVLHEPAKNIVTWTLDYNKKSDVHDSVGYWYVEPHPQNPTQWARVHYSTELSLFSWVPKFIGDIMSKSALHDAVTWVKKHSELKYKVATQEQQKQLQRQQQQVHHQNDLALTDHHHYFGFPYRLAAVKR